MADTHWLDSGAAGLSYDGGVKAPHPTMSGGVKPAAPAQPMKPPTSPQLGAGSVPGAGSTPPAPGTPAPPKPTWGGRAWQGIETASNATTLYQLGRAGASRAAPYARAAVGAMPKVPPVPAPSLATAARGGLAGYGAYALADAAVGTPYQMIRGTANLEGLQQSGVHNSWISNVGQNLMRPGKALWGMMDATQDGIRTGVREYFRGRQLDNAPRPTMPMTGGGDF